jgi:hypothetical protein
MFLAAIYANNRTPAMPRALKKLLGANRSCGCNNCNRIYASRCVLAASRTRLAMTRNAPMLSWPGQEEFLAMRLWRKLLVASVLVSAPLAGLAVSCSTQGEMNDQDRGMLSGAALRIAGAVAQQDFGMLQSSLLPAEAGSWEGIRGAAQQAVPLIAGGTMQVRNLYLLDASSLASAADTQFFCTDKSGSINVTVSLPQIPPGKYALALTEATGAQLAGQLGIIMGWDAQAATWKLAGLTAHQGLFDGHDGVWYWTRGRANAKGDPWTAYYSYAAARYLLLPVDFLTSPNLEKLQQEQSQINPSPESAFPLSLQQGDRTWRVEGIILDPSLREPDLGLAYISTGVTDPAALRTEATSVMSALLKAQPGLRANFHGLWAYAVSNGKRTPVMELPMGQIP